MKLTARSSLSQVVACVAEALAGAGIRCVLTGGACASLYTRGAYQSSDLDFVIQGTVSQSELDAAMATSGFTRRENEYVHPGSGFFVEFPPGPLAIGGDSRIQPVQYRVRSRTLLALSATDSCRDRLAAFYFWNDRQSLRTAVEIAVCHAVDFDTIRKWSSDEGHGPAHDEFRRELARAGTRSSARRPDLDR